MLYLNNPLLTSERIIFYFETNLAALNQAVLEDVSNRPSQLSQLKSKLKANFFENLDKTASDQDVLDALANDERFKSNYPKLKQVLTEIFSLTDMDDKYTALKKLKIIDKVDWNTDTSSSNFDDLNKHYGYFSETPSLALRALFTELAIACRTMIVLFEKNNDLNDTLAYDYAYKLMALFVSSSDLNAKTFDTISKETYSLVSKNDSDKNHPFHDTLQVKLHLPKGDDLNDQVGWRELIKKEGIKSFYFLAMAKKIVEKIAEQTKESVLRAPKSLTEANSMAMLCSYTRAEEDSNFA